MAPRRDYRIPRYDLQAFLIEAELLLDWYLVSVDAAPADHVRESFAALWREALAPAVDATPTWVLRDYHSPNLMWLPDREDVARIGILDFQDMLLGPGAYDVASLLQDARVDVSGGAGTRAAEPLCPRAAPRCALRRRRRSRSSTRRLAAQRATKILGIFARLNRRDGKPQYLRHIPRLLGYLQRSLAHPALAPLKAWYAANVPSLRWVMMASNRQMSTGRETS